MASSSKPLLSSELYFQSSAEESEDGISSWENQSKDVIDIETRRYQSRSKPQCFSKNAQMARKNRLKKKMYLAKLEKDVDILKSDKLKLSTVIENQSLLISHMKNEVKYLRGVLANSSDISKILKNVHQGTGMSVSTSLNKSLKINEICTSRVPISKKTMGPWEEEVDKELCQIPSSEIYKNELCDDFNLNFPLNIESDLTPFLLDKTDLPLKLEEADECNSDHEYLEDHNYTRIFTSSLNLEELQIYLPMLDHQFKVW